VLRGRGDALTAPPRGGEQVAFPRLTPEQITELRRFGRCREAAEGEVLWSEGDQRFDFYVVLSGEVEIVESSSGEEQTVTVHLPGEFTGDVDTLTGRTSLVTGRVKQAGEVLEIGPDALRRVVAELPEISDVLLRAFLMRRSLLVGQGYRGLRIIGSRFSPAAHTLRDFLSRNAVPFTWLDLEQDERAEEFLRRLGIGAGETPVVIGREGRVLRNPSVAELADDVGLATPVNHRDVYELVIVGGGPAGLAASVYAASEGLNTVAIDAIAPGGQAGTSARIENYLGFPAGISGADLTKYALLQVQKFGGQVSVPRVAVGLRLDGGRRVVRLEGGDEIVARCVLVATGADYRRLQVPQLAKFEGAGVYYAVSGIEARLCQGDEVVVVGGGNSAGQAIVYLARFARRVHVVIRGTDLNVSMSRYLVDQIEGLANVEIHRQREVVGLEGEQALTAVHIAHRSSDGKLEPGSEQQIAAPALFVFIGAMPHTGWLDGCVGLDRKGFVLTGAAIPRDALTSEAWNAAGRTPYFLETSLPGVFAAGDVRSGSAKRVASAVGEGAMAVSFVHAFLGAAV
jgi:thioredoxin reductase (NADPH)